MTDLAERIEAATGPDRELDAEIDALLGWRRVDNPTFAGGLIDMWHSPDGRMCRRDERLHAYTGSIDAAMMLLPEGWKPLRITWFHNAVEVSMMSGFATSTGRATIPALALAAAAIRAGAK